MRRWDAAGVFTGPGADGGSQQAGPCGVYAAVGDDGGQRVTGKIEEDEQPMFWVCGVPDNSETSCSQQVGPDVRRKSSGRRAMGRARQQRVCPAQ